MYLHLKFEDGSSPYLFRGRNPGETTRDDCLRELKRWKKHFDVLEQTEEHNGIYATLRRKPRETRKDFYEKYSRFLEFLADQYRDPEFIKPTKDEWAQIIDESDAYYDKPFTEREVSWIIDYLDSEDLVREEKEEWFML